MNPLTGVPDPERLIHLACWYEGSTEMAASAILYLGRVTVPEECYVVRMRVTGTITGDGPMTLTAYAPMADSVAVTETLSLTAGGYAMNTAEQATGVLFSAGQVVTFVAQNTHETDPITVAGFSITLELRPTYQPTVEI